MDKIHEFEKENRISFSNRKELIQFVSKYLANQYKEHCEFWRATARDDPKEMVYWEERIEKEVPALEKAVKNLLYTKRYSRRNQKFNSKSVFFKEAFEAAQISSSPINCIPCNVEYQVKGRVFKREVKCRPI